MKYDRYTLPVFTGRVGNMARYNTGIIVDTRVGGLSTRPVITGSVVRAPVSAGRVGKKHCMRILSSEQSINRAVFTGACSHALPANRDRQDGRCSRVRKRYVCSPVNTAREHGWSVPTHKHIEIVGS